MTINRVSKEFFEEKYRADHDPWQFSSSSYELDRYGAIMRVLGTRQFDSAFEPGCSIGVLTDRLAERCRRLLAMDISPTAVALARERCARHPHVTVVEGTLPGDVPVDLFDLVIFSEIGYYFETDVLAEIRDALVGRLSSGGLLVAAHWLGVSKDHILSGDDVHRALGSCDSLKKTVSERHDGFLLEAWERP